MNSTPADDPVLLGIISSALEMLDQGIEPPIEQLCGDREDLVSEVRVAIHIADDLPSVRDRASSIDPHLGRTLGSRYRLRARLGAGAMGVVYQADDEELSRRVAVKILRTDTLAAGEAAERFVREAELLAAIRHPAVVTIFDRGQTEAGESFLVMELLEGRSLSDLLETGTKRASSEALDSTDWLQEELGGEALTESSYLRLVVQWVADLASGLSAVHQAGIYHRDVKPSNVFVGRDGKPQLLDFGIASSEQHATLMREGGALGTPAYMAPEALSEDSVPGPTLDVYGLTATLYHMLVMQAPYGGSPSQIIAALCHREPKRASQLRPGLPRDLQAILDKGMSRRVSERYATAAELESDLRAFLQYRPVSARPITPLVRVWRKARRSTPLHAAAAVAFLGLALAGGLRWRETQKVNRHEAFMDVYEHFPPSLTLGPPSSRVLANDEERAAIQSLLDDAVRLSDESLPVRSLRASFRLDHGDTKGAAADMEVVASELGTRYTAELSQRYAQLAAEVGSKKGLDLEGLPNPETALDKYLAGYHSLRSARRYADFVAVRALFETASLADFPPAQELLIPLIDKIEFQADSSRLSDEELAQRAMGSLENYSRALRLEERLGQRTATTAFLLGTTLTSRELYDEAIEPYMDGLELCRWSYGLNLNLGIAARRLQKTELAADHLRAAMELRPSQFAPYKTLVRLYIWTQQLAQARELLAIPTFKESEKHHRQWLLLRADVEFVEVLILRRAGKLEPYREAAAYALSLYVAADSTEGSSPFEAAGSTANRQRPEKDICEAIVLGDEARVFGIIGGLLSKDPLRWRQMSAFLDWMPDQLDEGDTGTVRTFIQSLRGVLEASGS